jgi:hypothetical protein
MLMAVTAPPDIVAVAVALTKPVDGAEIVTVGTVV